MAGNVLIGLQWGDEGKGKVIDHLAATSDAVVRFQGGGNAGHTVVVGDKTFILHLLPSGILHPGKECIVGPGVVVDPATLVEEIDGLEKDGLAVQGRLCLSHHAHVVLPHHKLLDGASESRRGDAKIGTTKRGIGPTYADKASRTGLRLGDLLDEAVLTERLDHFVREKKRILADDWSEEYDLEATRRFCLDHGRRLRPFIGDGVARLRALLDAGKNVLFEGAQGTLLDTDLGTYPFVTSSTTTVGGVFPGAGISPRDVTDVIGVTKAYMTRVGAGPFPTEDEGPTGARLREKGGEFGATTGRPRRCGWHDAVAGAYAVALNGVTRLAVTKLDVLSGFDTISVCTAYEIDGERTNVFDPRPEILARVKPVFEEHPGWSEPIEGVRSREGLPKNCLAYLDRLQDLLKAPVAMICVGPERSQIIEVD